MAQYKQKGFTLLELALVIAVLGIITYTAMPLFDTLDPVNLDTAARKLEADIRYAQTLSTTTGDPHGFRNISDGLTTTYEIYSVITNTAVTSPYDHEPMQEDFNDTFQGVNFVDNNHDIQFDGLGKPTIISGTDQIPISNKDGSQSKIIEIVTSTGLVRIQ